MTNPTPTSKRILARVMELGAEDATKSRLSLDVHRVIQAVGEELEDMEARVRLEIEAASVVRKKRGRK